MAETAELMSPPKAANKSNGDGWEALAAGCLLSADVEAECRILAPVLGRPWLLDDKFSAWCP